MAPAIRDRSRLLEASFYFPYTLQNLFVKHTIEHFHLRTDTLTVVMSVMVPSVHKGFPALLFFLCVDRYMRPHPASSEQQFALLCLIKASIASLTFLFNAAERTQLSGMRFE